MGVLVEGVRARPLRRRLGLDVKGFRQAPIGQGRSEGGRGGGKETKVPVKRGRRDAEETWRAKAEGKEPATAGAPGQGGRRAPKRPAHALRQLG